MMRGFQDKYLVYAQCFDVVPQIDPSQSGSNSHKGIFSEPSTGMYVLKRAKRTNGTVIGNVIPLDQLHALVDIVPCFGKQANSFITKENSVSYSSEFWLNKRTLPCPTYSRWTPLESRSSWWSPGGVQVQVILVVAQTNY